MAAFLDLIQQKRIDVEALIDKEVTLDDVTAAYEALASKDGPKPLAIVIAYPEGKSGFAKAVPLLKRPTPSPRKGLIRLGLIGVGSFAKSTHLPNIQQLKQKLHVVGVCTGTGATAAAMGRQLGASLVSTDYREIINAPEIDAVLVSTRHNNHAEIAETALKAGKHIYLEKPLALTMEELNSVDRAVRETCSCPVFMVGFNRRYSQFTRRLSELLSKRTSPLLVTYRVNSSLLPENHWIHTEEGGGRLRGEACHMVDLLRFLVNRPLSGYDIGTLRSHSNLRPDANFAARFEYDDGSLCTLIYTTMGSNETPKERAEFHWDGKSAVLEDFKNLSFYGCSENLSLARQDKGHASALETFVSAIITGIPFPIPWEQLHETTRATIELDLEAWARMST